MSRSPLTLIRTKTSAVCIWAFPGGNSDPRQDADFRMTALRETFEETSILLVEPEPPTITNANTNTPSSYPTAEQLTAARLAIHSRTDALTLPDFLARHRLRALVDKLIPFSQWVAPDTVPVRFHTRFYVLFVEELEMGWEWPATTITTTTTTTTKGSEDTDVLVRNPTADGGVEVISASWIHPRELFAVFRRGELALSPPQFYLFTTLRDPP